MRYTTLISTADLQALLARPGADVLVCDCSFDLADPQAGHRTYAAGHLPGAVHVDMDTDLSSAKTGQNGRHPLPSREQVAALMARLGAGNDTQVVAYDATGMGGARLWWMLRWAGHDKVAVLDGGIQAWKNAGGALETGSAAARPAGTFALRAALASTIDYQGVKANLASAERLVVDARAEDRFRGENETIDPVGGHIPGAVNRFFRHNLAGDGTFRPAAELRADFERLLAGRPASQLVSQCGSGVTACHNLLALEVAGLSGAALYPGSWSEWCNRPDAPIATGNA